MSVELEDLKPKSFTVEIKEHSVECKPPRLSHALAISKIGDVFQNQKTATFDEIKQAEKDMDLVFAELMPQLSGIELGINEVMQVITQIMEHIQPADNKELNEKGVKINSDPKVEKIG